MSWEATGWWRVVRDVPAVSNQDIWCEVRDEEEARARLDTAPYPARLERLYERRDREWRTE